MNANWQKSLARRNAVGWLAVVALLAVSLQGATLISNWSTHRLGDEVADPSTVVKQADSGVSATSFSPAAVTAQSDAPLPNGPAPVYWTDGQQMYRAVHFISKWNSKTSSWQQISPDLTEAAVAGSEGYRVDGITALSKLGSTWYVGTLAGSLSVGVNGHWQDRSFGLPNRTITAIAICPDKPDGDAAVVGFDGYSAATPDLPGHVYETFDGGTQWTDISGNLPDAPVQSLHFVGRHGASQLVANVQGQWYAMEHRGHWVQWNGASG
jgi:hypothetical protein